MLNMGSWTSTQISAGYVPGTNSPAINLARYLALWEQRIYLTESDIGT